MNFLVALRVPRLMPHESDFVDESRHVRAYEALMDPLAVIMVHHVLLEMRFVAEDLPAVRAGDFVHHVSVADVILEDALRWISFVASVAGEHFRDLRVFQLDVPTAVAKRMKVMLMMEENNKKKSKSRLELTRWSCKSCRRAHTRCQTFSSAVSRRRWRERLPPTFSPTRGTFGER